MCMGGSKKSDTTPPPPQPATVFDYTKQRDDGRSQQANVIAANTTDGKGKSFGAELAGGTNTMGAV